MEEISIYITLGLAIFMVLVAVRGWTSERRAQYPSLLVTIGIFGTFLGIAIALFAFDAGKIAESVPDLLGGMRVAFFSSVIGLALALILRFSSLLRPEDAQQEGKTADDIFSALERQTELMRSAAGATQKSLAGLERALVGDGDTTLISQLKLMRSESRDAYQGIREELRDFAKTLAESNSKALFEALEGAVRDFNTKISEQFGENFKQLNSAVGQLLLWQQEYREQLAQSLTILEGVAESLQSADSAISGVAENSKALALVSERQNQWLEAQARSQAELEARLEAFADLAESAASAFPIIEQNLAEITQGVKRTVMDSLEAIEGAVEGLGVGADAIQEASRTLSARVEDAVTGLGDELLKISEKSQEEIRRITEELSDSMKDTMQAHEQAILEATDRNQARLEESVKDLDRMLGEELSKSLESLGNHLATLSKRFVEDYTPLTDRLRHVVELSRRIES